MMRWRGRRRADDPTCTRQGCGDGHHSAACWNAYSEIIADVIGPPGWVTFTYASEAPDPSRRPPDRDDWIEDLCRLIARQMGGTP